MWKQRKRGGMARRAPRVALLGVVLAGLWSIGARPVSAADLWGRVSDAKSGAGVASGMVTVLLSDGAVRGAYSDTSGAYRVSGIPAGRWGVTFQAFGFATQRDTLQFAAGDSVQRDVALEAQPFEVPEITVRADPSAREKEVQPGFLSLTVPELRRAPGIVEQDIIRSLQLLPGVSAASDFSSGLYIRGGGPDQTLILLDDTPVYNPTHAFGFFSTFNGDAVRDVNLYKSAYPAPYGGRLGSVLDVRNRDGNRERLRGVGGASVIAGRVTLEGPIRQGSWLLSGRRTYLDPLLSALRSADNEIPAFYFYDLNGRLNRTLNDHQALSLSAYHGRDDLRLDLDTGSFVRLDWGNTALSGTLTHQYSPGVIGRATATFSDYSSRTRVSFFDTPAEFTNSITDVGLKGILRWDVSRRHDLEFGLSGSRYAFALTQEFNGDSRPNFRSHPLAAAAWIQDEWTPTARTSVRSGLRGGVFGAGSRLTVEPRLSASHALSNRWRLKGGAGLYNQYLQLVSTEGFSGTDFWVPTDETLDPGRSWQVTGGLEYEPSLTWQATAELYATRLSGLVQIDDRLPGDAEGNSSTEIFRSGGTGKAWGAELFLQKRTGPVTGWVGYTLGWSRRRFPEVNQGETFPPKYDRRHDFKLVVDYRKGKWGYGAAVQYATGQAFTPAGARYVVRDPATGATPRDDLLLPAPRNSGRLLPFHRIDVSVTRKGSLFKQPVEWFLQIFNVTNRKNEWFIQYDTENPDTEPEVTHQLPLIPTLGVNFEF